METAALHVGNVCADPTFIGSGSDGQVPKQIQHSYGSEHRKGVGLGLGTNDEVILG